MLCLQYFQTLLQQIINDKLLLTNIDKQKNNCNNEFK